MVRVRNERQLLQSKTVSLRHHVRPRNRNYLQSISTRIREIAADMEENGIYTREIAADSRETGITGQKSPVAVGKSALTFKKSLPTVRKWPQTLGKSASTQAAQISVFQL